MCEPSTSHGAAVSATTSRLRVGRKMEESERELRLEEGERWRGGERQCRGVSDDTRKDVGGGVSGRGRGFGCGRGQDRGTGVEHVIRIRY